MVTMQDIAEHANVSRRTVSCVLSGQYKKARISEVTKDKILLHAEKLGYKRNALATAIKTGKTNVVGIVGKLGGSYGMEIIKGINAVLSKKNYMIKLLPAYTLKEVENVARQCVEQRLAGVICRSLTEEGLEILRKELEPHNVPVVLVDSSFSHDWCSRVVSDDFEGGKQATEYLLKLGHRKIGFVSNELTRGFSKNRYDGYAKMMDKWNIEVNKDNNCIINDIDEIADEQKIAIKDFLTKKQPTAVFCASDPLAMKIINIASSLGIKVPENLSVIGFAGLIFTAYSTPTLSTVQQPFFEMGQKASKILLTEIKEKSIKQEVKVPVKLIIRDSCKDVN